jgi:glycosyltransferase involved in cell wall biosynthesis
MASAIRDDRREDSNMLNNETAPTVSGVIPAYNAEKFLAEAIESALAQTYPLAELVVVDDGSTDRTAEVAGRFPQVRVIRTPNRGQGAARNTGVDAAFGEWIAFLDADDSWHRQKNEVQLRSASSGVGVIYGDRGGRISFDSLWRRRTRIAPSGALVRRQALVEVGGFEESRDVSGVEDLNLWLRIALTDWRFAPSPSNLFTYRRAPGSQSSNDLRMARAELANVDRIAKQIACSPKEIDRRKRIVRLEYARNLIGAERTEEARELLNQCEPGIASRWLQLALASRRKSLARVDVLKLLLAIESWQAT